MSDNLAKLRQCILLLSSEHDGEIVNAARAINRLLGAGGKDWHWLASSVGGGEPVDWEAQVREAYELGRRSVQKQKRPVTVFEDEEPAFENHRDAANWLIAHHGNRLNMKEREFLESMLIWRGWPTEKQANWLSSLCLRYGYVIP